MKIEQPCHAGCLCGPIKLQVYQKDYLVHININGSVKNNWCQEGVFRPNLHSIRFTGSRFTGSLAKKTPLMSALLHL